MSKFYVDTVKKISRKSPFFTNFSYKKNTLDLESRVFSSNPEFKMK